MLKAVDLRCRRDGRELFEALDLSLEAGELIELRGPNGSGKSTLLRVLAGLFAEFDGQIEREASLLYMGHRPGMSTLLTVGANLRWLASLEARTLETRTLDAALTRVGLQGFEEVQVGNLSAGQGRRAALARLALTDASIWLLDEPLTALDARGEALIGDLLREHCRQGGAALVATHQDLPVACSRRLELG